MPRTSNLKSATLTMRQLRLLLTLMDNLLDVSVDESVVRDAKRIRLRLFEAAGGEMVLRHYVVGKRPPR